MIFRIARPSAVCVAMLLSGVTAPSARADQEADLLRKFQQQNQKTAAQAKATVEKNLARVFAISARQPEQALELLRQARAVLNAADALPRPEKVLLARRLDDGFRDVKARLESKAEAARNLAKALPPAAPADAGLLKKLETGPGAAPAHDPKLAVRPILFQSNLVPQTFSSGAGVTPVVLPGRRWVRISIGGVFFIR